MRDQSRKCIIAHFKDSRAKLASRTDGPMPEQSRAGAASPSLRLVRRPCLVHRGGRTLGMAKLTCDRGRGEIADVAASCLDWLARWTVITSAHVYVIVTTGTGFVVRPPRYSQTERR
jgi:hypothetical protein